jgi:hypothetical protein
MSAGASTVQDTGAAARSFTQGRGGSPSGPKPQAAQPPFSGYEGGFAAKFGRLGEPSLPGITRRRFSPTRRLYEPEGS